MGSAVSTHSNKDQSEEIIGRNQKLLQIPIVDSAKVARIIAITTFVFLIAPDWFFF
jgi:hypothetical protein